MPTPRSQQRLDLRKSVQQFQAAEASSLVALQMVEFTAADSMPAQKDFAHCNADAGAFQLALPSVETAIVGKPYVVKEVGGTNAVTLTTPGSELINGAATLVITTNTAVTVVLCQLASGTFAWESI